MSQPADIQITGLDHPLSPEEIEALVGKFVQVLVGGTIPPEGISWYELFRFARVISISKKSGSGDDACHICECSPSRYNADVQWESGYVFSFGNTICERCVDGVVTSGQDKIPFGEQERDRESLTVSTTYDVT